MTTTTSPIKYPRTVKTGIKREVKSHLRKWGKCQQCPIGKTTFNHVLFRGHIPAHILFIGEAPDVTENTLGRPFTGPPGDFLESIVNDVIPYRTKVCYTNIIACHPCTGTGNTRDPESAEIDRCSPRILEFINLVEPRLIVLAGPHAHRNRPPVPVPCVEIRHPSYIIRKKPADVAVLAAQVEQTLKLAIEEFV